VLSRTITLPIEAGAALRETLAILDDHQAADDPYRAASLNLKIFEAWNDDEWETLHAGNRAIDFEIDDAAMILHGLAFTETMSSELPWFDMVQWTVDFIVGELRPQWTDDEWEAFSRSQRRSGHNPFRSGY
jgi:hypothetical protein